MAMSNFTISHTTKTCAKLTYQAIAEDILGKSYVLSLNFVGVKRARDLNQTYRQKSYVPNVLSFPLTEKDGEIYINPSTAKKEAPKFSMTYEGYVGFLFIHALLHLKGFDHGTKMEKLEKKYCVKYHLK